MRIEFQLDATQLQQFLATATGISRCRYRWCGGELSHLRLQGRRPSRGPFTVTATVSGAEAAEMRLAGADFRIVG